MFLVIFGFILSSSLHGFLVSANCVNCEDEPEFSTSSLVVEYGGPANVSCRLCRLRCMNSTLYGLEAPQGISVRNGTTLYWTVDDFTQWKTTFTCHYTFAYRRQCCTVLPVVSYKPPQNVSLSTAVTEPVMEGRRTTLQCNVSDVAFVGSLNLTIYRENTSFFQKTFRSETRDAASWTTEHMFRASKDDHGAVFWCKAELGLDVGGGQRSVAFTSNVVTTEVYYAPRLKGPETLAPIRLSVGDPLRLDCSAEGNPAPNYTWTGPASPQPLSLDGVLSVGEVTSAGGGDYVCSVNNLAGTTTFRVTVEVKVDHTYLILGLILGVAILAATVVGLIYARYHRLNRTGEYSLIDILNFPRSRRPEH